MKFTRKLLALAFTIVLAITSGGALLAALPYTISNGDDLDATKLMANLNTLDARFPVANANIASGLSAAKLTWPSGTYVPSSAIPTSVSEAASVGSVAASACSDASFARAYNLPYTHRVTGNAWPRAIASGYGYATASRDGVLVPMFGANIVYEIQRNTTANKDNLYSTIRSHTLSGGDGPVQAVAISPTQALIICQTSRLIKTTTLGAGSNASPTTWLDLTAGSYTGLSKACVNKHGSYMYVLAKKAGDNGYRRIVRVDLVSKAYTECVIVPNTASADLVDIAVHYPDLTGTGTYGYVWTNYNTTTQGFVYVVKESGTGAYNGTFPAAPDYTAWTGGANETVRCLVPWGDRMAILVYNTVGPVCKGIILTHDAYGACGAGTFTTNITKTLATTDVALAGSAASDGKYIYFWIATTATIDIWDPLSGAVPIQAVVAASACVGAAAPQVGSSLAYSGRGIIGIHYTTGTNNGYTVGF